MRTTTSFRPWSGNRLRSRQHIALLTLALTLGCLVQFRWMVRDTPTEPAVGLDAMGSYHLAARGREQSRPPRAVAIVYPQERLNKAWRDLQCNSRPPDAALGSWAQVLYRPQPQDLGFYDMVQFEHRKFMRILAERFGVYGFCFLHHWPPRPSALGGSSVIDLMLIDGEPRLPFTICWRPDGHIDLTSQNHTGHFYQMLTYFKHPLYIRSDDRPLFYVQSSASEEEGDRSPWMHEMERLWQDLARREGLEKGVLMLPLHHPDNADASETTSELPKGGPPIIRVKQSVKSFEGDLRRVFAAGQKVTGDGAIDVMIDSWNGWQEQSALEPNDIKGYDALYALRRVIRRGSNSSKPIVVHVSHQGGGTEHHIRHLMQIFPDYEHLFVDDGNPPSPPTDPNIILLHIHSVMPGKSPKWGVLRIAMEYRSYNIPIYITLHDFQLFYPEDPNPYLERQQANDPLHSNIKRTALLFELATKIIFPDPTVINKFQQHLVGAWNEEKMMLVRHADIIHHTDLMSVPSIKGNVINIAIIGMFFPPKGAVLFSEVARSLVQHRQYTLEYHQIGVMGIEVDYSKERMIFHGGYDDLDLLRMLMDLNVHVVTFLSLPPETYSYSLSRVLRLGIPIVYLRRGSFISRLDGVHHAFPIDHPTLESLEEGLTRALDFVVQREGTSDSQCGRAEHELSLSIQPNRWYLEHYPHDF